MTVERPKVSIGLPVYNGERYLSAALDGMLRQTFEDFEIVISDNASTDSTREICSAYCKKDDRIRYSRNDTNIGSARNYNKVFALSRGSYFAWAAHDDLYGNRYLESCVEVLDNDPSVSLCYSVPEIIDAFGKPIPALGPNQMIGADGKVVSHIDKPHIAESPRIEERFRDAIDNFWCLQVFGLIRAENMRDSGLQRGYYGADKIFLAEISLMGRFHQIDEKLFFKRVHIEMSFYLNNEERAKWIDPDGAVRFPQVEKLKDYVSMVLRTKMSARERMICFSLIAERIWHKIFIPGPNNYLGINFSQTKL